MLTLKGLVTHGNTIIDTMHIYNMHVKVFYCIAIVQIQQLKTLRSTSQEMAESFWILYYNVFP